ncbi:hypothetical protein Q9233_010962 [Columba guinea]|nr:hypothetical protein Q9233_010962 [Columba guinea]
MKRLQILATFCFIREIHIDICGSGEDNWPFDMDYRWGPTGANGDPLVWWAGKNKELVWAAKLKQKWMEEKKIEDLDQESLADGKLRYLYDHIVLLTDHACEVEELIQDSETSNEPEKIEKAQLEYKWTQSSL